ncbi:MAG: hypothetical protein MHMPM18_005032, partial [Marteilia pararefringens]
KHKISDKNMREKYNREPEESAQICPNISSMIQLFVISTVLSMMFSMIFLAFFSFRIIRSIRKSKN